MKILFLDIDGPMIPSRAYSMPGQTKPVVMTFDPVAVGLINDFCKTRKWKIVLHSSWIRVFGAQETYDHCLTQGLLPEHFHEHAWCDENENWRYTRVAKWLEEHPDTSYYLILDDEPYQADIYSKYPHPEDMPKHLILVDFDDGIITSTIDRIEGIDARTVG